MKNWPYILAGLLMSGVWIRSAYLQLRSGRLIARGGRAYAKRQENPMLYWSAITLEITATLFVLSTILLGVLGALK